MIGLKMLLNNRKPHATPGNNFSRKYSKGFKWCTKEAKWIKTKKLLCPDCHMWLRSTVRNQSLRTKRVLIDAYGNPI